LVTMQKELIGKPTPKRKENHAHLETWFDLQESWGTHKFSVFMREHVELLDRFSIGIIWIDEINKRKILFWRYNWIHHDHTNRKDWSIITWFHKHIYDIDLIEQWIDPLNTALETNDYSTAHEALIALCSDMNILNYIQYFPKLDRWLFTS
jgi:hypothetical protein